MRREDRGLMTTFMLLMLAIAAAAYLLLSGKPRQATLTVIPPQPTATPGPLSVYVTGAVLQPNQTVTLARDSRVSDALAAAGGAAPDADMAGLNLSALLYDGDQVHVPVIGQAAQTLATPSSGVGVGINTANLEQLGDLPGVGPVIAQRILDHRAANGRFNQLSDLDAVSGIGPKLLEQLAPLIRFD